MQSLAQENVSDFTHLGLVVCLMLSGVWVPSSGAEPEVEETATEETADPLRLNLKECLQHALKNHPSLHEVKWDIALREADVQQARSGYYPTGEFVNVAGVVNDATGNILRYRQGGIDESGPCTRLEGQLVYPLFTSGKIRSGLKAATKGLEQELLSEDERKAQVIREVKEFYYTLLYTKQVQQLLDDVRGGFEQAVQTAEAELEKGTIAQTDVLQLRIGYAGVA
ncbi:MAG: TolC family protein [Candidatus Binatia bacterium]